MKSEMRGIRGGREGYMQRREGMGRDKRRVGTVRGFGKPSC